MASSYRNDVSLTFDSQPSLTAPQHRRGPVPTAPLGYGYASGAAMPQPPPMYSQPQSSGPMASPGPNMAFMSFDLSNADAGAFPAPLPRVGPTPGASGYGSSPSLGSAYFEDEPPLLEELGINIPQILSKTTSALNPFRVNPDLFEDGELSGPLMFVVLFGLLQLLAGKVHFGVILGWAASSSVVLWGVVNLLLGNDAQLGGVELYKACSIFGYSLLPMVLYSGLALFIPHKGPLIGVFAVAAVAWCCRTCSSLLLSLLPQPDDIKLLILYLCGIVYSYFALIILF